MEASRSAGIANFLQEKTGLAPDEWEIKADSLYTRSALTNDKAQEILNSLKDNKIKAKLTAGSEHGTSFVRISNKQLSNVPNLPPQMTPQIPARQVSKELKKKFEDLAFAYDKIESIIEKKGGYDDSIPTRFGNVPCPQWTQLRPYKMHANRVELEGMTLILSQAPKPESETDFWKTVSENSYLVLDLTNRVDRTSKKIQRYFPHEIGEQWKNENVSVICIGENIDIADLKKLKRHDYLVEVNEKQKNVSRLHFRGWPDGGAISVNDLKTIVDHLRSTEKETQGGQPLWIHCSAGVGRSGTVAVALVLSKMSEEGKLDTENYSKVIDKLIMEGRTQRGPLFVQAAAQYQLLHDFAELLVA